MTVRARLVVAACAAVALLPVPAPPASASATIADVGWWSRQPGAAAKPAGGFEVAEAPDDDVSVAALRIRVPDRLARAMLVLRETGGVRPESAALRVCVTTASWTPANPGAFAQRPAANCAGGGIALARASTGGTWVADVRNVLPAGSTVSLMIVPAPPASGLPVDGFQVAFAGAVLDAEAVEDDEDDGSSLAGPVSSSPSSSPPTFGFGFGGEVDAGLPGFDIPLSTDTSGDPAVESADGDPGGQPAFRPPTRAAVQAGPGTPWGRLPALVVLAAFVGAAAAFARRFLADRGLLPSA